MKNSFTENRNRPTSSAVLPKTVSSRLRDYVHLAVDLQHLPSHGQLEKSIAHKVGRTIAPAFNALGIPTCWIYDTDIDKEASQHAGKDILKSLAQVGGFYEDIKPSAGDKIYPKTNYSAFQNKDLKTCLHEDDKKIIIISGLDYACCVLATVYDACAKGYHVILLEDGTDLGRMSKGFPTKNKQATWHLDKNFCPGLITEQSSNALISLDKLRP